MEKVKISSAEKLAEWIRPKSKVTGDGFFIGSPKAVCFTHKTGSSPRYLMTENDTRQSFLDALAGGLAELVVVDPDESGKDFNRPEFQRMMRDVEAGQINTVVAAKFDRLSRAGILDFYRLLERFNELGTDCISVKEQFDTSSASGRAFMGVHMVFARYERELTAERTADTMAHRARESLFNGGHIPFGHKVDPNRKGHLIINREEADIVLQKRPGHRRRTGQAG